jgi:hypothetical protein
MYGQMDSRRLSALSDEELVDAFQGASSRNCEMDVRAEVQQLRDELVKRLKSKATARST